MFAYIRVSTKGQNIARLIAMSPIKVPKQNIYCDYQLGYASAVNIHEGQYILLILYDDSCTQYHVRGIM